jgi:hypothetical protein
VGREACDLVAETLGGDNGDFIGNLFVGLKVECEAGVVLFNEDARGFLDGLGANTALSRD